MKKKSGRFLFKLLEGWKNSTIGA